MTPSFRLVHIKWIVVWWCARSSCAGSSLLIAIPLPLLQWIELTRAICSFTVYYRELSPTLSTRIKTCGQLIEINHVTIWRDVSSALCSCSVARMRPRLMKMMPCLHCILSWQFISQYCWQTVPSFCKIWNECITRELSEAKSSLLHEFSEKLEVTWKSSRIGPGRQLGRSHRTHCV